MCNAARLFASVVKKAATVAAYFAVPAVAFAQDPLPATPTPAEHRAKFNYSRVQPLLDLPMIDAAITRAPDDTFYLTGTTGTQIAGAANFSVNDGVHLWMSHDLQKWEPLGLVAPRAVVRATLADLPLLRTAHGPDEMRGLIAPELRFVAGRAYITYALEPQGTGLLRSTTGEPAGPYEDLGLITTDGHDASLFEDDDGSVYWVFGGGWIARMKDDLSGLAEEPRLVQPATPNANTPGGEILQVGTAGAFMFKRDGTYHLLAAGIHGRIGVPCYDTFVATAASLDGPWSQRKVAVAHGGQSTMFEGPDGQWYATFSGVDSRAALRERAAVVPVDWVGSVHYYYPRNQSWPWKRPDVITEAWGWEHARPLADVPFRDPMAADGGDGFFYASGLHNRSLGLRTCLLKGKDLAGDTPWEAVPIAGFETVDKFPWYDPEGGGFTVGTCKPFNVAGTCWISLGIRGGGRLLRSTSGTMKGPFEPAVKDFEPPAGARIGYWSSHPFQDYRGDMYGYKSMALWPMNDEFTALADRVPPTEEGYEPVRDTRLQGYSRVTADGSAILRGDAPIGHQFKIDGKYLMMGGCDWHGEYRRFGTYDSMVFWAHEIGGPWHPNRSVLPHSGNSGLVQDGEGTWWNIVFANDNFLPDGGRLRCLPLEIKWNGNGYDIGPKHKQETPYVHRPDVLRPNPVDKLWKLPWPLVELPADIVLKDPAVTSVRRDGAPVYYLTGTAGERRPDGTMNWRNNDGLYMWKSADLSTWEPLGKVFDLRNPTGKADGWSSPVKVHFSPPDSLEPTYDRGILSPELHRIGDDFWIVFSAGGQQVCLLKSVGGGPEGPYAFEGPATIHGGTTGILDSGSQGETRTDGYFFAYDPSLFVDDDGSAYVVFGPGWIAKLQDDPAKGLAERPRLLKVDGPQLYAGKGGCQVYKRDGLYHLLATTEWGDALLRTSKELHGPYTDRRMAVPGGGQVKVFAGPDGAITAARGNN